MLFRTIALAIIAFALCTIAATEADATAQRTFVRSDGVDNPSCSLAAPCRGFGAAVTATSPNGEVIVLDSAGYGIVTITKAVSIIAPPGVYAGISVFAAQNGITVSAGPTDKVVLRGLTINGQGGNYGIYVTSGKATHIEDCTVSNMAQDGIYVVGGTALHVARSVFRSNAAGISVYHFTPTTFTVTLTESTLTGNTFTGFHADIQIVGATINAAITRVTVSGNGATALEANTNNLGTVTMVVADTVGAENGGFGVWALGTNATAIVSGSSFVRNTSQDFNVSGSAVIRTAGNNAVTGRGAADIGGVLTSNPLK